MLNRSLRTKVIRMLAIVTIVFVATISLIIYLLSGSGTIGQMHLWKIILIIAASNLILISILYLYARRIVLKPLGRVAEATRQVASGNFFVQPIPVQTMDELGSLSTSINTMSERIRDLFEPFQTFIEHNRYAMILLDADYHITSFNRYAEELLGYPESEVLGKQYLLVWQDSDQLRARAQRYSQILGKEIAADESALFSLSLHNLVPEAEWNWIKRDGSRLLVSVNPSVMRHSDGSIKGYVLFVRDYGEIKRTVETNIRLLEIMEKAHDVIASFDLQGNMFYINHEGMLFLGIPNLNAQSKSLVQYMPREAQALFANGLIEAQNKGHWQNELAFIRPDGGIRITSITVVTHMPADDADIGKAYFSSIIRDITELKETQNQLLEAKIEAEQANDAKSSFLARMSHEIRTPLNGIVGLAQLLKRSELDTVQKDYVNHIATSSESLLMILNDILDFSKLEADKLIFEQVHFSLEQTFQSLCSIYSVLLGPKPVEFIVNLDPRIPTILYGDPVRLQQVLLNLGSNAIKFTNIGMIEIDLKLVAQTEHTATIDFRIQDTGIGMSPEQMQQLFTPFVQADEKISRKYGGTGLGLVISNTIVSKLGGMIEVQSERYQGSSFSFQLEFGYPPDQPVQQRQMVNLKILVLEDHPVAAKQWHQRLTMLGCETVVVESWADALVLIMEKDWDYCVLDMESGDMHGEETWITWKSVLDERGISSICATTMLGRDALQQLPDYLKPATVFLKPITCASVYQFLSPLSITPYTDNSQHELQTDNPHIHALHSVVLIVDDHDINRYVASEMLQSAGLQTVLAQGGREALRILDEMSTQLPDLVLMDLHMPEMDGIETTLLIRKRFDQAQLPIIALTADITKEQHEICLEAGMNDLLTKPIEMKAFYSKAAEWIGLTADELTDIAVTSAQQEPGLRSPLLDTGAALSRLNGKATLYRHLLDKFSQQYASFSNELEQLLQTSQTREAIRFVHSAGGAAGSLGAEQLQHAATVVETALKEGACDVGKLKQLRKLFALTLNEMRQFLHENWD